MLNEPRGGDLTISIILASEQSFFLIGPNATALNYLSAFYLRPTGVTLHGMAAFFLKGAVK